MTKKISSSPSAGWINGFIGVLIFSGSLPATRLAVMSFDPYFLTASRAAIAGLIGLILLLLFKQKKPTTTQLKSLFIVVIGVVLGFPLLTALALEHITSAHSIIFLGLLPLSTAIFGVISGEKSPSLLFWFFSVLGSLLVISFALFQDLNTSLTGDLLMFAAVVICGLGYAEGAKLSKSLGGWQVISWALVLSLPVSLPFVFVLAPNTFADISLVGWLSLSYVSLFSMLIGFIFWYRGLAQGGITRVSQLQLLQPFFGLFLSAYLLHEQIHSLMIITTVAVIMCVIASRHFSKPSLQQSIHKL